MYYCNYYVYGKYIHTYKKKTLTPFWTKLIGKNIVTSFRERSIPAMFV